MSINEERIDILNRGEFIDQVVQLVHLISNNKGNMTFAINGEWGCGKTFVLDAITERLDKDKEQKFLVIPYNCWQYDYYSEPLVAIVSALLDFIDDTKVLSESIKLPLKKVALNLGKRIVCDVFKNKLGLDVKGFIDEANSFAKSSREEKEEAHSYDSFYGFKHVLKELQDGLTKITDEYSIVLAVDELDRCMPEYAIKVLERLHHIADGIPNMITIVSVDKKRLAKTIGSIFGEENVDPYLKKFIRFEMPLDGGKQDSVKFFDKFREYYDRFDVSLYGEIKRTEQFLEELFRGMDIRSQERIIEKAILFNDVCFGNEKKDHTVMYMVLFLVTLYYHYKNEQIFDSNKRIWDLNKAFARTPEMPLSFSWHDNGFSFTDNRQLIYMGRERLIITNIKDIYNIVLFYWYNLPKSRGIIVGDGSYQPILDEDNSKLRDCNDAIKKNLLLLQENILNLKILA